MPGATALVSTWVCEMAFCGRGGSVAISDHVPGMPVASSVVLSSWIDDAMAEFAIQVTAIPPGWITVAMSCGGVTGRTQVTGGDDAENWLWWSFLLTGMATVSSVCSVPPFLIPSRMVPLPELGVKNM